MQLNRGIRLLQKHLLGFLLLDLLILLTSAACIALNPSPADTGQPLTSADYTYTPILPTGTMSPIHTPTQASSATPGLAPISSPTASQTLMPSASPSPTDTPTSIPTVAFLRGTVMQRSNCRYGPGAPYLYKYGLLPDTPMDVIGRTESGTWLLIQARGGDNPCWIKASLMEVQGDLMRVAPTYIPLPLSPYYGALSGVAAVRQGDEVTVSWNTLSLRAGDEVDLVNEAPYVVEAWVCQDGELIFIPVGAYTNMVIIQDQAGCTEPSHARVYGAEKHGYTPWVEIPWPPAGTPTPEN